MEVRLPLPFVTTAGGFMEKYGPDERYNYLRFTAAVQCPTLVTFGGAEVENNMAFRGAPDELQPIAARHGRMRTTIVAGADHFYTGAGGTGRSGDRLAARLAGLKRNAVCIPCSGPDRNLSRRESR